MKHFYIGLSKNKKNKIGSILLQKYMGKNYSHCFIEFDTRKGVDDTTILHSAAGSGVSYWSNFSFEKVNTKTYLYKIEVTPEMFKAVRVATHKHAGNKYGFWQNIGILAVDFCKHLGFDIKNPFRDNENCSELVFLAMQSMHPELTEYYNNNTIRPDHIQEILEGKGYENILDKKEL